MLPLSCWLLVGCTAASGDASVLEHPPRPPQLPPNWWLPQVSKLDTLAGLAIRYNVSVRLRGQPAPAWSCSHLNRTCSVMALRSRHGCCSPALPVFVAGLGHQALQRPPVRERHLCPAEDSHPCGTPAAGVRLGVGMGGGVSGRAGEWAGG